VDTQVGQLICSKEIASQLKDVGLAGGVESYSFFDSANSDILEMRISRQFKVFKILLRKLFRQQVSGRVKTAFFRGMGDMRRELIDGCLLALAKHNLVYVVGNAHLPSSVWYPNRAHANRASFLIDCTVVPNDILLTEIGPF
jgi:hypothetical protein